MEENYIINYQILGRYYTKMNKKYLHNLIPIILSIVSIIVLAVVFFPIITSDFTIVNESIAIPDHNSNGIQIAKDGTIQDNLIIQLLGGFKILEGFFFHHHMSFLLPVYYLDIGIERNIHQYGILTSYFIWFISKSIFNEVSINSYMLIIQSFLLIFPICILFIGFKIYKNKYLASLLVLFYVFTYLLLDFLNFYLTPTVSPIRQIFIPFIFYFIYKITIDKDSRYLFPTYSFLILQSFVFIELSIFLVLSLIIQLAISKSLIIHKNMQKYNLLTFIIITLIFFNSDFNSDNYFSSINFIFLGPELELLEVTIVTVLLLLLMYIVSSSYSKDKDHFYIRIIGNYAIFSLFYFIWNPATNHLVPIIWTFSFLLLFFIDRFIIIKNFSITFSVLFLTMIFITTYAVKNFYHEKNVFYNSVVKYLKKYDLKIDKKINMKTTMDSSYIYDSCRIINKYEKNKFVNLISIHDSYLPFLCNKANSKYDQLIINMVNDEIKNNAYSFFKNKEIIFVDNIIDAKDPKIYYSSYSNSLDFRIKIKAIDQAREIFNLIKDKKYILIEKGKLLSVYRRIN